MQSCMLTDISINKKIQKQNKNFGGNNWILWFLLWRDFFPFKYRLLHCCSEKVELDPSVHTLNFFIFILVTIINYRLYRSIATNTPVQNSIISPTKQITTDSEKITKFIYNARVHNNCSHMESNLIVVIVDNLYWHI